MTSDWQKVLESKLDQLLLSTQTMKESIKSLHNDFQRLDSDIDLLQVQNNVTTEENVITEERFTLPYFEEFLEDNYYEFPDFYYLRFRQGKIKSPLFMPHVFIV